MSQSVEIHHELGDVVIKPHGDVNSSRLKKVVYSALDNYLATNRVPVSVVHDEVRERHQKYYQTSGYFLRLYRKRAGLTQVQLAERADIYQRHLSEMENNKRPLGKNNAKKLANVLECDYQKLL